MANYFDLFDVSASGMRLERVRLETATLNIANAHTSRTADGGAYRPLRVVAAPSRAGFEQAWAAGRLQGVGMPQIVAAPVQPRMVYDPGHPHADARGYVTLPGIDPLLEMTTLMNAMRAYEANIKAIEAARTMALRALEIGSR